MIKFSKQTLIAIGYAAVVLSACAKKDDISSSYEYQNLKLPETTLDYVSDARSVYGNNEVINKLTNAGATLGRVLFYDKRLSLNNTTSCGSCHSAQSGFSDTNKQFSQGFANESTTRNAMHIVNMGDNSSFFWDGRASSMEQLSLMPVRNHIEMGIDRINDIAVKLNKSSYYPELFKKAFGDEEITKDRIANALSQFVNSIVSDKSKFDIQKSNFTAAEKHGENLFFQQLYCGQCHNGKDLDGSGGFGWWGGDSNNGFANIGLDKIYKDEGRVTADKSVGLFKVPSLRNVALTAPYMHDGRFKTLEEVINHYSDGIANHPDLDSRIRFFNQRTGWNGGGSDTTQNRNIRLGLTAQEKSDLIAFLRTLTDHEMVKQEKYTNPFLQ